MRSPRPSASVGSVNVIPLQLRENEIEVACQALSCSMHMLPAAQGVRAARIVVLESR